MPPAGGDSVAPRLGPAVPARGSAASKLPTSASKAKKWDMFKLNSWENATQLLSRSLSA